MEGVVMKVGGRDFDASKEEVESAMRGETPDLIQKYVVEVNGTVYPPKQVLARVTGWPRQSFTTMEAQRVLTRIGFTCRKAGSLADGTTAWVLAGQTDETTDPTEPRIAALEAALATAQEAIAGLAARVRALEAGA
jgi:hypothetical protein